MVMLADLPDNLQREAVIPHDVFLTRSVESPAALCASRRISNCPGRHANCIRLLNALDGLFVRYQLAS